ncbi:hypothetical protein BDN72DRAFT_570859 [Pluteus cervinus]|uniref:Uncharacterized protein n=1 Tax=Pluteus cervinus TaxID=181527 RepID=A0ACD3AXM6_9AGAR|nr:hypothetical protein BDN72DRAFT_570859 [Pluteus cervinus]
MLRWMLLLPLALLTTILVESIAQPVFFDNLERSLTFRVLPDLALPLHAASSIIPASPVLLHPRAISSSIPSTPTPSPTSAAVAPANNSETNNGTSIPATITLTASADASTSSDPDSDSDSDGRSSIAVVAGSLSGGIVLLAIVLTVIIVKKRNRLERLQRNKPPNLRDFDSQDLQYMRNVPSHTSPSDTDEHHSDIALESIHTTTRVPEQQYPSRPTVPRIVLTREENRSQQPSSRKGSVKTVQRRHHHHGSGSGSGSSNGRHRHGGQSRSSHSAVLRPASAGTQSSAQSISSSSQASTPISTPTAPYSLNLKEDELTQRMQEMSLQFEQQINGQRNGGEMTLEALRREIEALRRENEALRSKGVDAPPAYEADTK